MAKKGELLSSRELEHSFLVIADNIGGRGGERLTWTESERDCEGPSHLWWVLPVNHKRISIPPQDSLATMPKDE